MSQKPLPLTAALAALFLAGCNCGPLNMPDGGTTASTACGPKVQGQRYAMCLQSVSSLTQGTLKSGATTVGSVASSGGALVGSRYTLTGGSFHASK